MVEEPLEPLEPPPPLQAPAPQECGWFGSSLELREGLEVMELSVGLLAAVWPDPEVASACSAA